MTTLFINIYFLIQSLQHIIYIHIICSNFNAFVYSYILGGIHQEASYHYVQILAHETINKRENALPMTFDAQLIPFIRF